MKKPLFRVEKEVFLFTEKHFYFTNVTRPTACLVSLLLTRLYSTCLLMIETANYPA